MAGLPCDRKVASPPHPPCNVFTADATDKAIIAELERDGRLTNVAPAQRVGLTTGPCLRRVQRLEADGVIRGYRAVIDPAARGRSFEVLLSLSLEAQDAETVECVECFRADAGAGR
ncbi:Lrp/AsnC family transcriptional regulator [Streptomyces acidicola]|uniref:Lrp/AsnC family transcriptional regulator n=1 Tax=Streptomyces acidicola TaxID=2596892 RepID=UPI003F4E2D02